MAKPLHIDGVDTIMNFNSGFLTYRAIQHQPGGECCFCHQFLNMTPPPNPGDRALGVCQSCGSAVEYLTLTLSYELAKYFDVRGPSGNLGVNGIMHVYLPEKHPEFNALIKQIDPSLIMGNLWAAEYGEKQPKPEFYRAQEEMLQEAEKIAPGWVNIIRGNKSEQQKVVYEISTVEELDNFINQGESFIPLPFISREYDPESISHKLRV